MANKIITIEREYASGGREIGKKVAEELGIPFYNREILEMAAERCSVSPEYLENAEEAAPKSFLYSLMLFASFFIIKTFPFSKNCRQKSFAVHRTLNIIILCLEKIING